MVSDCKSPLPRGAARAKIWKSGGLSTLNTQLPPPARESSKLATTKVYPATLFRQVKPTLAYYSNVLHESEARLALEG